MGDERKSGDEEESELHFDYWLFLGCWEMSVV